MSMIEKISWWCIIIQLPIYIAQQDAPGGLHWEQTTKGIIFFWWAILQNMTRVFSGAYADKYGQKRTMLFSFVLIVAGYIILGTQKDFYPFLFGIFLLGIGSGIFKPANQGAIAKSIKQENSSVAWAIYAMCINIAVFIGSPITKELKEISWEAVFIGSAILFSINFFLVLFIKEYKDDRVQLPNSKTLIKILKTLFLPKNLIFLVLIGGYTLTYMQFYETLPNFIYDWSDSSALASKLPQFMLSETERGIMISYEWLFMINSGFTIAGVIFISYFFSKFFSKIAAITIGVAIAVFGLVVAGSSMAGIYMVAGMFIYTLGEIITNPKLNDYMSTQGDKEEKSLYLSLLGISWTIGLAGGALLGGYVYKQYGEKSGMAVRYLSDNFNLDMSGNTSLAFAKLMEVKEISAQAATELLWNQYDPFLVWLVFGGIGLVSVVGLAIYSSKYK